MAEYLRASRRPNISPSPSRSLQGMERVIPPPSLAAARSKAPSIPDMNKPLPLRPRKSSSIYSSDSGYTQIIESYNAKSVDEPSPERRVVEPTVYRETISHLLNRRLGEQITSSSAPSIINADYRVTRSPPISQVSSFHGSLRGDDNIAPDDMPSISSLHTSPRASPLPPTSPIELQIRAPETSSLRSMGRRARPDRLQQPPQFKEVSYHSADKFLPGELSPRITDVVDHSLLPEPLFVGEAEMDQRATSRFSTTSSSDDSVIFYHGFRESIRGYLHHRRQKKQEEAEKKEREQIMSTAAEKYPQMKSSMEAKRFSSNSRRHSLQQGLSNIYDKIRQFSISGSSGHSDEEVKDPRRNSKQRAIPVNPYQKYGAVIWDSPKRREKEKQRIRDERKRAMLGLSDHHDGDGGGSANEIKSETDRSRHQNAPLPSLLSSFQTGQKHLLATLEGSKDKVKMTNSEKKRDALKKSIQLIGPADQFADGRVNHWF